MRTSAACRVLAIAAISTSLLACGKTTPPPAASPSIAPPAAPTPPPATPPPEAPPVAPPEAPPVAPAAEWGPAPIVTTSAGYKLQLFDDTVTTTPLALALKVAPPSGQGTFSLLVELLDPTNTVTKDKRIEGQLGGEPITVPLGFAIATSEFPLHRLRVTPRGGSPEIIGLQRLRQVIGLEVLAPSRVLAGGPAAVRLVARSGDTVVPGAKVKVSLDGRTLLEGETDANGTVDGTLMVPEDAKSGALLVSARTATGGADASTEVEVRRERRILLTTDKPLYQPGQTIHVRALAVKRPQNSPVAGEEAVFEVQDPKGNKVFRQRMPTTAQGVAHATFVLASELILGTYRIKITVGDSEAERTVEIKRYTLPKFKVAVTPGKAFYRPGDTIEGSVEARYFFGETVKGKATVSLETFDIGWSQVATAEGAVDPTGRFNFTLALPSTLVGQPLADWKAMAKITATVVDSAGQDEGASAQVPVAPGPARVEVVVPGNRVVPGVPNEAFVLVTSPDQKPIPGARVTLAYGGGSKEGTTGQSGIADFSGLVGVAGSTSLAVTVQLPSGETVLRNLEVTADGGPAVVVAIRTPALIVGDVLEAEIHATGGLDRVFVDVIRDQQAILTKTVVLSGTGGKFSLPLSSDHVGTLIVQAYHIGKDMTVVRDARPVLVTQAQGLGVKLEQAADTKYKPGEEAKIVLAVADAAGKPVENAALGVAIVDEALFALADAEPGLLKLFFALEKELLTPKIEVHAFDERDFGDDTRRVDSTRVLGAAANVSWTAGASIDTAKGVRDAVVAAFRPKVFADATTIHAAYVALAGKYTLQDFEKKLWAQLGKPEGLRDPWGRVYQIAIEGQGDKVTAFKVVSAGPDDQPGTADDIAVSSAEVVEAAMKEFENKMERVRGAEMPVFAAMEGAPGGMVPAEPMAMAAPSPTGAPQGGGGGGAPVRVRQYFPETLYVNPLVLTGPDGKATLNVTMADSITTWRLTATASDSAGRLGGGTSGVVVFQDFFVDLDLPESLTRGDEMTVPVAVYNYADGEQTVNLEIDTGAAFELVGETGPMSLTLAKGEVRGTSFRVRAKAVGRHGLTVTARGTVLSDAVKRDVRVVPDGTEVLLTDSGVLDGSKSLKVDYPGHAIPGANGLFVKVYPGSFSQVVDGLDAIFQMPSGCFEQTSSTTYPNILALRYLRDTKKASPEVEAKALSYLNQGWQRLLTFEVQGGGFSWFGEAPANKILTAFGVQEFKEMSAVFEIDEAVLTRTQAWLIAQQEADGSWKPDANFLHQENWGDIQKGSLLVTAYIARALAVSGVKDPGLDKAIAWLDGKRSEAKDPYSLALIGGAFAAVAPQDAKTREVLSALGELAKRSEDGKTAYWEAGVRTAVYGMDQTAAIETTALAALAFMTAKQQMDLVNPALAWLVSQKDSRGTWHATMPTVLALSALVQAITGSQDTVSGTITVTLDGEKAHEWTLTPEDSDVVRFLDLSDKATTGAHEVKVAMQGQGNPGLQLVARHYLPEAKSKPLPPAFDLSVTYDKTALTTADLVTATATATSRLPVGANMLVLDLAVPPGFDVLTEDLDALVSSEKIERYTMAARQIIVYLDKLDAGASLELRYRLKARVSLKAQSGESRVYAYYEPEKKGRAAATLLEVAE